MSRVTFENYGKAARNETDLTQVSGRYNIHKPSESLIVQDVASKLSLNAKDCLLEIGCGPGNLLIPLSFFVSEAYGIDHPDVCSRLKLRFNDSSISTCGMNFLDYEVKEKRFSKILIYSVLNTLTDANEAAHFIDKAVSLLSPGGILLLGDIANIDKKQRFLSTKAGMEFQRRWEEKMDEADHDTVPAKSYELDIDQEIFQPDDNFVLTTLLKYREAGMHSYLLSQPEELPFGMTREDIVIRRPL